MANFALAIHIKAEPVRSLAFGSVSSVYTGIGTGFIHPIRQYIIQNLTNQTVWISMDGVHDTMPLASMCAFTSDITSNKSGNGMLLAAAVGERIYVKQFTGSPLPSSGAIYVTAFYASDGNS